MPAYAVYRVRSFAGTVFSENDVPDKMTLLGVCEAINGEAARDMIVDPQSNVGDVPVLVLRMNTIEQNALKLPGC